jgi:hypothetical protein
MVEPTLIAAVINSTVAADKNHLSLFNSGGALPLEVWRVEVLSHLAATVAGTGASFYLHRTTALGTGGSAATIRRSETRGATVPTSVQAQANVTLSPAASTELAGLPVSTEEAGNAITSGKNELFQANPLAGVQPIVLWTGEGIVVRQAALASAGAVSIFIYFCVRKKGG